MEHEHAVGAVVGDSGAREMTQEELSKEIWGPDARTTINGTVETVYVGEKLVAVTDRDPKYKIDFNDPAFSLPAGSKPCRPIPYDDDEGPEDGI